MFDASTKFPSGILYGSTIDLGNFDECLDVKTIINKDEVFGRYCLPSITIENNSKTNNKEDNIWRFITVSKQ